VARALALVESDYEGEFQAEHHVILGELQAEGIWGYVH